MSVLLGISLEFDTGPFSFLEIIFPLLLFPSSPISLVDGSLPPLSHFFAFKVWVYSEKHLISVCTLYTHLEGFNGISLLRPLGSLQARPLLRAFGLVLYIQPCARYPHLCVLQNSQMYMFKLNILSPPTHHTHTNYFPSLRTTLLISCLGGKNVYLP